ncbi:MAG: aspartate--tRNA(Asn) ligase, partial [Candidatus Heimdallarchaeota archaeon]
AGWVHFFRDKGNIIFIHLRDSSGICQILVKKNQINEDVFKKFKTLTLESVISVTGVVQEQAQSINGVEIIPNNLRILSLATPKLPLDVNGKVKFDTDTEFKYREISIRTPRVQAIMKIKSEVASAARFFFTRNGFTEIFTPYILGTATEGGAEMFKLDYFGSTAVLAQSCQFYKQASVQVHEKVFGIIPSWRAEKSRTLKHTTEFHQIENEIAFGTDKTIMEVQENLVHSIIKSILENCKEELKLLQRNLKLPSLPLKRITFYQAKELLETKLNIREPREEDFSTPAETALSNYFDDPFFITKFPTHLRGMYYEKDPDNEELTNSLDLMAPEGMGEMSSGGQRVASSERILERINNAKLDSSSFEWYIRMFKYGFPPHAGYGLGFERLVRWVCGLNSIKDAIMFPRTPDLIAP